MKIGIIIVVILIVVIILIVSLRNLKYSSSQSKSEIETLQINMVNSIFYHEDDYRQIEIVPCENFRELIKHAENIKDFSKKHFDGDGYTEIMVRDENGFELKQRGINPKELDLILSELPIKRYAKVYTGIRPGEIPSENTYGYGENYHGIFFDFEADSVTGIWITGSLNVENEKLTQILNSIGNKWSLLLMDWNTLELIDIRDKEQIEKYLK